MKILSKILMCSLIIMIVVTIMFVIRFIANEKFIKAYNEGNYDAGIIKIASIFNITQQYIYPYNVGDVSYKQQNYGDAVSKFTEALGKNHPDDNTDCMIRINLALAIAHMAELKEEMTEEEISNAINILTRARDVLLEKGCAADEEGATGHNETSQQLKEEIDKLIEMLKNAQGGGGQQGENDNPKDEPQEEPPEEEPENQEDNVEERLKREQQQAGEERRKQEQNDGGQTTYSSNYTGDKWMSVYGEEIFY